MKHSANFRFATLLAAASMLISCVTAKEITFLQDMEYGKSYEAGPAPELVAHRGDVLSILVTCDTPQLSDAFNTLSSSAEGSTRSQYPVNNEGDIVFPILGEIHAEGLTLLALKEKIKSEISSRGFIKSPSVDVQLANFSVTVIGNGGNQVIKVDNSSLNIFQALAMSGQIPAGSNFSDVMVIRTEDGIRKAYGLDLKSKNIYDSPAFYLKQNDMVYIKMKSPTLSSGGQATLSFVGIGLSLVTIITNVMLWSTRR